MFSPSSLLHSRLNPEIVREIKECVGRDVPDAPSELSTKKKQVYMVGHNNKLFDRNLFNIVY